MTQTQHTPGPWKAKESSQFPGPKGLKEGQTVEMDGKSYSVVNVGYEWIQLKDEATGDRLKVSHGDLAEDLEAGIAKCTTKKGRKP